jgi:alkanesulfonate monooxygenase SsuD/methylene tetrahydromethanopterin reductase-like flavin-dependent oxidoreductase (luciferase family)
MSAPKQITLATLVQPNGNHLAAWLAPAPQGHPVIIQAGASETGKELAAATAEVVFGTSATIADAVAFYQDLKGRMARYGRAAESLKILGGITVIVGDTAAAADAPTWAEQGYPQMVANAWYGFSGSAGIPPALVARLNASLAAWLATQEAQDLLRSMAMQPEGRMSSAEYTAFVAAEVARWAAVARAANIRVER